MKKILIVDDEESMRRLLRINLEDRYEVIDTGNPMQALAMAMQDKPSAILLDLRMPQHSGLELCRTFSSVTSTQLIPIIIVSGDASASTQSLCEVLGAKAYFQKPVDFESLRAGLAEVLDSVRAERRSELRLGLRVMLKLRGTDLHGTSFEEVSATANVSKNGFLCGCSRPLKQGSTVEVFVVGGGANFAGKARLVRSEECETPYPRYGFRFSQKEGDWVVR
jgi:DNA-binding response OmpR family regulator